MQEIHHLLEEELNHLNGEAEMEIVSVQGDRDAFVPYEAMATAIAEILRTQGECRPEDLVEKGFSREAIRRYWRMAYALAKVDLHWMDA